jgi:hypothetical protein
MYACPGFARGVWGKRRPDAKLSDGCWPWFLGNRLIWEADFRLTDNVGFIVDPSDVASSLLARWQR